MHYRAQWTGDRAEAIGRLQRSHIDARARLNEFDLIHPNKERCK